MSLISLLRSPSATFDSLIIQKSVIFLIEVRSPQHLAECLLLICLLACLHVIWLTHCIVSPPHPFNCIVLLLHSSLHSPLIPLPPAFVMPLVFTYCLCPSITRLLSLACCIFLLFSPYFLHPIHVQSIPPSRHSLWMCCVFTITALYNTHSW